MELEELLKKTPDVLQMFKYIFYTNKASSRLTIVSREAKKSQRPLSELFTGNTAKELANALAKPPWQLAPSYYSPNTFLLHRIDKPTVVEIGATILKYWPLRV